MRCLLKSFAGEKCIYGYIKCFLELGPEQEETSRRHPGLGSVSCTQAQETWPQGWPLKSSFPNQTEGAGWNPGYTELRSRSPSNLSGPGMSSERCPCPSPSLLPLFPLEHVVLPALWWCSWPACLWPVPSPWHIFTSASLKMCKEVKAQFQENPALPAWH